MTKRIVLVTLLLIFKVSLSGFAQETPIADLQRAANRFSSTLAQSLPLNASLGLNWSDAHIGRFPRFGVGVSAGFTTIELSEMEALAEIFGFDGLPNMDRFPFPGYAVEARLGGFVLPFDIGFKFGYLPPVGIGDIDIDYMLIGGSIRYAVLNRPILPTISLGVGFNFLRGSIGGRAPASGASFTVDMNGMPQTITIDSRPEVNLHWQTFALDFTAQISRSFLIFTPYLGLGLSYAWSTAGYEVDANISGLDPAVITHLRREGIDVSDTGMSSEVDRSDSSIRVFGGISFNMAVIRLDLTGIYSFRDGNYGASVGLRFQL